MAKTVVDRPNQAAHRDATDVSICCVGLSEADVEIQEGNDDKGQPKRLITLTLLREGPGNPKDKRWYEKSCVEGLETLIYQRKKLFMDHLAEGAPPASDSMKNWAATLVRSWTVKEDDGSLVRKGMLKVHDNWLWERCQDPVARKEIAVSIEGRGQGRMEKKNGQDYTCIEKIYWLNAFKFVPYPGNANMGLDTVEAAAAPATVPPQEENDMKIEEMTLAQLREGRPDLVEEIEKAHKAGLKAKLEESAKASNDAVVKLREEFSAKFQEQGKVIESLRTQLEESERKADGAEIRERMREKEGLIERYLKESNLPEDAKTPRFMARLKAITARESTNDKGEKIILSVEDQIKAEVEEQFKLVKPVLGALPPKPGEIKKTVVNGDLTEAEVKDFLVKHHWGLFEQYKGLDGKAALAKYREDKAKEKEKEAAKA